MDRILEVVENEKWFTVYRVEVTKLKDFLKLTDK